MPQQAVVSTKRAKQRLQFFAEIITELKKVVWLSWREVRYLTVLVLVVALVFGLILGLLDLGFTKLMDVILLK
ncbi:MAG: preprotein translocase subunit SecE [Chloroflexi bacterium]|nr:preprotein translocase subunit SecE [Chloroflexota bacterium]